MTSICSDKGIHMDVYDVVIKVFIMTSMCSDKGIHNDI